MLAQKYGLSLHKTISARDGKTIYIYSNQPKSDVSLTKTPKRGVSQKVAEQLPFMEAKLSTASDGQAKHSALFNNTNDIVEIIWTYKIANENKNIYDVWGKTVPGKYMESKWKDFCTGIESRKTNDTGKFLAIQETNPENGFKCSVSNHAKKINIHTPMHRYSCIIRINANAVGYTETFGLID